MVSLMRKTQADKRVSICNQEQRDFYNQPRPVEEYEGLKRSSPERWWIEPRALRAWG